ncbi:MAG: hypothetical protein KDE20_28270, partial [Caldilineaceae bacterium]|nr:hypothetical protein [Caldilineaceae bacterium]
DLFVPGHGWVRNRVTDPYSVGLDADSQRSWIGRLDDPRTEPPGWRTQAAPPPPRSMTDMVIYELHVRDFSRDDATVRPAWRGKYLGFTEPASDGMRHLRALADAGLTDVHLLKRHVLKRCIYGVDLNPMAAELAKVSLWLEAVEPGKPMAFLDANIRVGNALLGTTPALLATGVPDEAFVALTGDDKKVVAALKKENKRQRQQAERGEQHDTLFGVSAEAKTNRELAAKLSAIT